LPDPVVSDVGILAEIAALRRVLDMFPATSPTTSPTEEA
jgi:hypothetical protein